MSLRLALRRGGRWRGRRLLRACPCTGPLPSGTPGRTVPAARPFCILAKLHGPPARPLSWIETQMDRVVPGSRKVIVIGAGAAGLSCAHTLDKRGVDVLVLDSDHESFADYGARHGGHELVEQMCDPLARSMVLAGPDRIGTVFGLRSLWSSLGNPLQAFRNPRRGIGSFASALSQACADFTRLSTPVERVVVEDGVVKGVVDRDGFRAADAVVCAATAGVEPEAIPHERRGDHGAGHPGDPARGAGNAGRS